MGATYKNYVRFVSWKAHLFLRIWIGVNIAHIFHPASVPTYTITSISKVAQTTGAIKGPLSVNTVSIHIAIMAVIQIALIDI